MRNHNLLVPTTTTSSSSSKNNVANKQQQEPPHFSGAYIRSLVKQLSSSSSTARSNKDHTTTMGTKPHGCHPQPDQEPQTPPPPQPQPQPHKKQVRRRLHTSRPYQERLLNMAEARREIVTALKIHRASMRQAKEQQQLLHLQHQQQQQQQQEVATQVAAAASVQEQQTVQQAAATRSASAAAMHHGYASFSDYLYNSPLTYFSPAYSSPLPYHAPLPPPAALAPPMAAAQLAHGDLLPLPAQPLGLNLSFHGFSSVVADVDGGDGDGGKGSSTSCLDPHPLFHQPSPASSYSVYSSPSVTTTAAGQDMSSSALTTAENTSLAAAELGEADPSLHRVLDDEEMAAIYSIGEQHDIEWSDTVNLVTSALWSKLLDTVEGGGGAGAAAGQLEPAAGGALNASAAAEDELTVTRMPDWFGDGGLLGHHQSTKESGSDVLGMHFSEYYHHGHGSYGEDVSLPRMDLGEIEGWNAEWFS